MGQASRPVRREAALRLTCACTSPTLGAWKFGTDTSLTVGRRLTSIAQTDVGDIASVDRMTGHVVLTVSDHLDWSDSTAHQLLLQRKLNRYLAFIESGEILQSYLDAKDRLVAFRVVFQFQPDQAGRAFLAKAKAIIESAGFSLWDEVFTGAHFNWIAGRRRSSDMLVAPPRPPGCGRSCWHVAPSTRWHTNCSASATAAK